MFEKFSIKFRIDFHKKFSSIYSTRFLYSSPHLLSYLFIHLKLLEMINTMLMFLLNILLPRGFACNPKITSNTNYTNWVIAFGNIYDHFVYPFAILHHATIFLLLYRIFSAVVWILYMHPFFFFILQLSRLCFFSYGEFLSLSLPSYCWSFDLSPLSENHFR